MGILKFLLKAVLNLFVLVVLLMACVVGLAVWSAPKMGPKVIDTWIESNTPFSATVGAFDLKLFAGSAEIKELKLFNPPYYQNKNFLDIKEISLKLNLRSLYADEIIIDYLLVDIDKVTWVQGKDGSVNLVEFGNSFKSKEGVPGDIVTSGDSGEEGQVTSNKRKKFVIKKLVVRLGKLDVVGFPDGGDSVQSFSVNYSREFNDVRDLDAIGKAVSADLTSYGIAVLAKGLFELPFKIVVNTVEGVVDTTLNGKITNEVQGGVNKVFKSLKKITGSEK